MFPDVVPSWECILNPITVPLATGMNAFDIPRSSLTVLLMSGSWHTAKTQSSLEQVVLAVTERRISSGPAPGIIYGATMTSGLSGRCSEIISAVCFVLVNGLDSIALGSISREERNIADDTHSLMPVSLSCLSESLPPVSMGKHSPERIRTSNIISQFLLKTVSTICSLQLS